MSTPNPFSQPSFFPTHAIDHAVAGIGAGTVAVLCMNPLDLLKVKFQVSTRGPKDGIGRGIWHALRDIHANEGWRGLYRGLSPNVAGNASSWGLYFLFYNQLKRRATKEIVLLDLVKFLVFLFVGVLLAGKFVTGEYGWGVETAQLRKSWPTQQRLFSESLLARSDGTIEGIPIYIAIDGDIFDVPSNRRVYGPGGSYALMAGVDAVRAFGTGCFKDHRTHDLRGLDESELQARPISFPPHLHSLFTAGRGALEKVLQRAQVLCPDRQVTHPPIDPAGPLPVHCDPKKEVEQKTRWGAGPPPPSSSSSQEKQKKAGDWGSGGGDGAGDESRWRRWPSRAP
ncbi:hypothetical protein EDB85DRAFT_2243252 [Lactarius pseudohatsudake]|nr:hypothetical protein EDB85DRAFT_2243252 [Lactarius pseudohatsudake]